MREERQQRETLQRTLDRIADKLMREQFADEWLVGMLKLDPGKGNGQGNGHE